MCYHGYAGTKGDCKNGSKRNFSVAKKYNNSAVMWQRRLSLVLVEYYTRDKSLLPEINKLVKGLEKDEEYYVKKVIAWINKNIAKGK